MKVAVFGASGFVGRNIIEALKRESIDVVASDLQPLDDDEVEFIKADILDYEQVLNVVKDCDNVVHLAASPLNMSIEKPKLSTRINVEGSLNIMDAARQNEIDKIIFSSASSLIGEVKYNPVDEKHPATPKTPYGVSKLAVEHYLRVYQEIYSLDFLVFRFFNIYGPWQYPESGALIPLLYKKLKSDGSFNLFGDGRQTRDFVYIEDLADFYVKAVKNDIKNEVVNLGTGKGTTTKEVVETTGEILGIEPKINYLPERPGEIDNFIADTGKLRELFSEVPGTSLKNGLEKTLNWLDMV